MQRKRGRAVPSSVASRRLAARLVTLSLLVGACAGGDGDDRRPVAGTITVWAAASLTDAFDEIGRAFTRAHPNTAITFDYGASSSLVSAIVDRGARVDVFAAADTTTMAKLVDADAVSGSPRTFAHNTLTVVTKKGNAAGIQSTADLARVGVVALCAPTAPCGVYAGQALRSANVAIPETHVTRGRDAAATIDAVAEGDAVAGIVYVTDALARAERVDAVAIPPTQNVIAAYPIAALRSPRVSLSKAFVAFVAGPTGQRILKRYGFQP